MPPAGHGWPRDYQAKSVRQRKINIIWSLSLYGILRNDIILIYKKCLFAIAVTNTCTSMGWVFYISTFDSHNKWKIDPKKTCRGREKGESHQNPRTRWRGLTPKAWSIKGNINKWNLTKIKNFYSAKDPTNKMKGQIIDTLAPENVHAKTCTLMFTVALLVITKKLETN